MDPATGDLWIADSGNCRIRVLRAASNTVSTVVGSSCPPPLGVGSFGPLATATLGTPGGIVYDSPNRNLYVTQLQLHVILRISVGAGTVSIVAGTLNVSGWTPDGPAALSLLAAPLGIAMGPDRASVYWTEV